MRNPFIVSGKIPDEYFCDRRHETIRLIQLLTNRNNVVLVSPRRMGKTGLIHHVFGKREIADRFNCIFVDILQTTSLQEFTFLLGKAVFNSLLPKGKRILSNFIQALKSLSGKFGFDPITGAPSFTVQLGDIGNPTYTLDEIFKFIESTDTQNLIAIDEFQQVANYPEKNTEALLRTHIQRLSNCRFIFAGSLQHIMTEMFLYPSRPFYHSASIVYLQPIPEDVYSEFAVAMFETFGKSLDIDAVGSLYREFAGTTFYLQVLLNGAFAATAEGKECTRAAIDSSLTQILEESSGVFREILSSLSIRQKELLVAVAKTEPVESITSASFIRTHGLASASSVQAAMKKLMELNLVVKSECRYSLSDKFLSRWLKKVY